VKRIRGVVAALAVAGGAAGRDTESSSGPTVRIHLTNAQGERLVVRLNDSAASRDFTSLLPLTLRFKDYGATEKVSDPPRKLTTRGAPAGVDPAVGDFAYYAPWGNLALYYRDFGYSPGLVALGTIESGSELLPRFEGEVRVAIQSTEGTRR